MIDLHGRLDKVMCLDCRALSLRDQLQARLADENPLFIDQVAEIAPDGDAYLEELDFTGFKVPTCERCGGTLKPDVVFFGEGVPRSRVDLAVDGLGAADALLVLGSSLMVYSGFRFCRLAAERGMPMAAVNLGRTRADALFDLKLEAACEIVLPPLVEAIAK